MIINCKNCGPTENWNFLTVHEDTGYFMCDGCGYRGCFVVPPICCPRRIIYLDQWALSGLTHKRNPDWSRLEELLLKLTSRQFWLCPMFQNQLDETSRLSRADSEEHFKILQRLACGRMLREPQEIKMVQVTNAFDAFIAGAKSWKVSYSDAHLFHDPRKVVSPFAPFSTEDLVGLRTPRQNGFLERARAAYAELRSQWIDEQVTFQETQQTEHNMAVEIHLDMLMLMTTGHVPKRSLLLKPGMLELYLDSVGRTVEGLLIRSGNTPDRWPAIESFFKSRHFGEVPHHAISIALFALLREQAQSSTGQPINIERQTERSKNDMNDAGFISVVLPYVSDILVDTKFADLLSKPKMARFVGGKRVWSPRKMSEIIQEAEEAVQSADFQIMDNLLRHLAPLEANEFIPRKSDEQIIYDGDIR